eukprot:CAMPEP_0172938458 /NCGR_PEP_ID=MMETSP1075-20121228/223035_1 /TAXON_ID=2916 /ORGANISM="Ceratium fusus, Strain PA161109" /LENGTH=953 /DNA_ID=CAMNT_0013799839 /DNA_START=36 /DNA_END=2897 /DNA_ORIENTATION=-
MTSLVHARFNVIWPNALRGHSLGVCGDSQLLGEWSPKRAVRLNCSPIDRQLWFADVPCVGISGEFRFLVLRPDGDLLRWEPLFKNRLWPGATGISRICISAVYGKLGLEIEELDVEEIDEPKGCQCSFIHACVPRVISTEESTQDRRTNATQSVGSVRQPVTSYNVLPDPQTNPPRNTSQQRLQPYSTTNGYTALTISNSTAPKEAPRVAVTKVDAALESVEPCNSSITVGAAQTEGAALPVAASTTRKIIGAITKSSLHAVSGCQDKPARDLGSLKVSTTMGSGIVTISSARPQQQQQQAWARMPSVGTWLRSIPLRLSAQPGLHLDNSKTVVCAPVVPEVRPKIDSVATVCRSSSSAVRAADATGRRSSSDGSSSTMQAEASVKVSLSSLTPASASKPQLSSWQSSRYDALGNDGNAEGGASYIALRLWVSCETEHGEALCVTGSDPVLGGWDLAAAVPLHTCDKHFRRWFSDVLLLEAPPRGGSAREVQYKFAVMSAEAAAKRETMEADEVGFEGFNRTLLLPGGSGGLLLEPWEPFVFGSAELRPFVPGLPRRPLGSHLDSAAGPADLALELSRVTGSQQSCGSGSDRPFHRGPTMSLDEASGSPDRNSLGMFYVPPSRQHLVVQREHSGSSFISGGGGGNVTNGLPSEPVRSGLQDFPASSMQHSSARFCMLRFWVSCAAPGPGKRVSIVGDDLALGSWDPRLAVPLQALPSDKTQWVSEVVFFDLSRAVQTRTIHFRFAVVSEQAESKDWLEAHQVRLEKLSQNRTLVISQKFAGHLFEPTVPVRFGDGGSRASFAPRRPSVESAFQAMLASSQEEELEEEELSGPELQTGGFARQRSCAAGDSMLNLVDAGRQRSIASGESMLDLTNTARQRSVAGGESMLNLANAAKRSITVNDSMHNLAGAACCTVKQKGMQSSKPRNRSVAKGASMLDLTSLDTSHKPRYCND